MTDLPHLRICYIGDAASIHTEKWARTFARDHEVHVISFRPHTIPGVRVHHLGGLGALGKARYPLQLPAIRRLLRQIDPDVVHALALTSYGFMAALAGRRPLVTSVWGYDILQAPHRTPVHRWITRYALRKADIVTATGEGLAEATRPFMPRRKPVHVVPYGVDIEQFSPGEPAERLVPPGGPVIGSVKALRIEKGFSFLIEAMVSVTRSHPDARLVLAGDGPERARLEQLTRSLGLTGNVIFLGELDHARVPVFLRHVDIYVQPSLTESFGVSALEASATAIPVIATAVEGGHEIVKDGETGFVVPAGESDALARPILRLLDDPAQRTAMGDAGRRFVADRYEWQANAAQMAGFYARALEMYRGKKRNRRSP